MQEVSRQEFDCFRENMNERLDEKVGFKHFYWVIGILVSIFVGMSAFGINLSLRIDDKVDKNNDKTVQTSADVSYIKGLLNNAIIEP